MRRKILLTPKEEQEITGLDRYCFVRIGYDFIVSPNYFTSSTYQTKLKEAFEHLTRFYEHEFSISEKIKDSYFTGLRDAFEIMTVRLGYCDYLTDYEELKPFCKDIVEFINKQIE